MLPVGGRRLQTKPRSPGKVLRAPGPRHRRITAREGARAGAWRPEKQNLRQVPTRLRRPSGFSEAWRFELATACPALPHLGAQRRSAGRRALLWRRKAGRGASSAPAPSPAPAPPPGLRVPAARTYQEKQRGALRAPRHRAPASAAPSPRAARPAQHRRLPRVPASAPPAPPRSTRPEGRSLRPRCRPAQGRRARCGRREKNGTGSPPELLALRWEFLGGGRRAVDSRPPLHTHLGP